MGIVFILLVVVIVIPIIIMVYTSKDHWSTDSNQALKKNAKVTNIETTPFNKYRMKTEVTFDDGFTFTAFDTRSRSGAMTRTLTVDASIKADVVKRAKEKHAELIETSGSHVECSHQWSFDEERCLDVCAVCGDTRPHHTWSGCRCAKCGETRDEEHAFIRLPGACIEQCSNCGTTREIPHSYDSSGRCTVCGKTKPVTINLNLTDLKQNEYDALLHAIGSVRLMMATSTNQPTEMLDEISEILASPSSVINSEQLDLLISVTSAVLTRFMRDPDTFLKKRSPQQLTVANLLSALQKLQAIKDQNRT